MNIFNRLDAQALVRVIDIETTGIDLSQDKIIEMASVDVSGDGIKNAMDTLVQPGRLIPPAASAIHHLIDDDVKDAPMLGDVIGRFMGADVYVAHNSEFERSFLAGEGIELGPWICTYKCALRVWPDFDGYSNQVLRYALGRVIPFPGVDRHSISPHRASFDVVVTAAIFEELTKKASWSDLVQWSAEPALHTRFHFGKHRGKRYDEVATVEPSYLTWIIGKSHLREDVKHSAKFWLDAAGH
jgi:exodeoxyribonuclease X